LDKHSESLKSADQKLRKIKMVENTKKIQTGYVSSVYDIPDSNEAEITVSQVGYKDLFDNMPNGCAYYKLLFDESGTPNDLQFMKVNSAYATNIGRPMSELCGKQVTEVFPQWTEVNFKWIKNYMEVALSGKSMAFTQYFDYQDKWYSIFAYSPQRGYVVEIAEDITERKRKEIKLEQNIVELSARNLALTTCESRYRGLLDHLHNIFEYHRVIVDENGQPVDLEFAEVNPAFEMRTGLKGADVVGGRQLPLITHGVDKSYWIQVLGDVALTGKPIIVEKYLEKTDTWYRVSAYSPEEGYVVSILTDITEQKKIAVQKSENQRQVALIERIASLGALASGVAHEINQPLQALKIMADGMIYWYKKGKETSMEKVIENCQQISVQAGYITAIIERMLDFVNRVWSDTPEIIDLNRMIQQAVTMVQERLKAKNIQLHENFCGISPVIWGDSKRLEEVIIIILVNAIESLDCIDQNTKEIIITTSLFEKKAVIEIRNNGPVIPNEIIGRIFEPFFSSAKSCANLGMGLAIVKSIVDAHNGTIQVFSEHQPVTFRIEFPLYVQ
jgi:signal transduction histidine kinase